MKLIEIMRVKTEKILLILAHFIEFNPVFKIIKNLIMHGELNHSNECGRSSNLFVFHIRLKKINEKKTFL